jgi:hypothetical protein
MNSTSSVSVYVLRERLHETWEKRESLRAREEEILKASSVTGSVLESQNGSLYEKALDAVVHGTEGYENLQNWRSRFIVRDS